MQKNITNEIQLDFIFLATKSVFRVKKVAMTKTPPKWHRKTVKTVRKERFLQNIVINWTICNDVDKQKVIFPVRVAS